MKRVDPPFWVSFLAVLSLSCPAQDLWAAEGKGGFSGEVFWQIISFILLAIFLGYVLKKPFRSFLVKRREEIKNSLDHASKKEIEAQRLLAEWEEKLNSLSREIAELHQSISREGEEERKRIIERALAEGERIGKQAQIIAEQEVKKARALLKREMVDLSLEMAEKLLKGQIQSQDQERLVREYVGKMKEIR